MMPRLLILSSLLLVVSSAVYAGKDVEDQACRSKDDSSSPCLTARKQTQLEKTDQRLNTVYRQLLKEISKPKDEYLDYPALKEKFIKAQRQWLVFRDSECEAWYLVNEAGADRNVDGLGCLIDRTQERIQQLQAWQKYLP